MSLWKCWGSGRSPAWNGCSGSFPASVPPVRAGDLDKLKVDEGSLNELPGPILRFKEIPMTPELATLLDSFVKPAESGGRLF